jgi:mono/diheme cytochrome c family protein
LSALVVALAAVGGGGSIAALAGEAKAKAPKLTPELATKGRATYLTVCSSCHGEKGDGLGPAGMYLNPKPRHFATEPFKQGEGVEQIFATLQTGVAGTAMVAFPQLTEEDRWAVAYYVAHFRPSKDGKKVKKVVDALPPLTPPTSPTTTPTTSPTTTAPTTTP